MTINLFKGNFAHTKGDSVDELELVNAVQIVAEDETVLAQARRVHGIWFYGRSGDTRSNIAGELRDDAVSLLRQVVKELSARNRGDIRATELHRDIQG